MDLFSDDIPIADLASAVKLFKESREGFLKLFNNSPVCMSMTTTNLGKRTYVRVNNKFLERFGYDETEIIGRNSIEIGILDQDESDRVRSIIAEKGRLQNDYVKCRAKNGAIVHTVSSIEKMDMNEDEFLISFFVDVTKIYDQQTIIENHVQQLEAVNKELEAFSYSVSHDLRAPLRAIDGYSKILEEDFAGVFDDDGKKALGLIRRNAQKMATLIHDLLDFAKMGKMPVETREIDMAVLVAEIVGDLKNTNHNKAEIVIGALHPMKGDHALMKQVMINLISNAVKYSSKKEKPLVEITSAVKRGKVIYTVRDNGAGFDMSYAQKLFGVFQRLHSASEFEGSGVGLAIVQRIVNKHGGMVRAESVVGQGATFTLEFLA